MPTSSRIRASAICCAGRQTRLMNRPTDKTQRSATRHLQHGAAQVLPALVLGVFIALGLVGAAWLGSSALLDFKRLDRTVEVKGLSEREVGADLAIWPIGFVEADNDLGRLYRSIESKSARLVAFLEQAGFKSAEIAVSAPVVVDKQAREYGGNDNSPFR